MLVTPMNTDREAARIASLLEQQNYIADQAIVTSLLIAELLRKPLLVEGPAGVGKTEIAKVMARALDTDLIRLQCYEGLDASTALYEWDYKRQLLHIRLSEHDNASLAERESELFDERYLLKRPLLQAITHHRSPVLLVDELDRADEEFEAFLLEVLSDWQISIPELGTVSARHVPYVVVTSNRTRDLSDAVRRRCLYLWIDYPDFGKELAIVRRRVDGIDRQLAEQICRFVGGARRGPPGQVPGRGGGGVRRGGGGGAGGGSRWRRCRAWRKRSTGRPRWWHCTATISTGRRWRPRSACCSRARTT